MNLSDLKSYEDLGKLTEAERNSIDRLELAIWFRKLPERKRMEDAKTIEEYDAAFNEWQSIHGQNSSYYELEQEADMAFFENKYNNLQYNLANCKKGTAEYKKIEKEIIETRLKYLSSKQLLRTHKISRLQDKADDDVKYNNYKDVLSDIDNIIMEYSLFESSLMEYNSKTSSGKATQDDFQKINSQKEKLINSINYFGKLNSSKYGMDFSELKNGQLNLNFIDSLINKIDKNMNLKMDKPIIQNNIYNTNIGKREESYKVNVNNSKSNYDLNKNNINVNVSNQISNNGVSKALDARDEILNELLKLIESNSEYGAVRDFFNVIMAIKNINKLYYEYRNGFDNKKILESNLSEEITNMLKSNSKDGRITYDEFKNLKSLKFDKIINDNISNYRNKLNSVIKNKTSVKSGFNRETFERSMGKNQDVNEIMKIDDEVLLAGINNQVEINDKNAVICLVHSFNHDINKYDTITERGIVATKGMPIGDEYRICAINPENGNIQIISKGNRNFYGNKNVDFITKYGNSLKQPLDAEFNIGKMKLSIVGITKSKPRILVDKTDGKKYESSSRSLESVLREEQDKKKAKEAMEKLTVNDARTEMADIRNDISEEDFFESILAECRNVDREDRNLVDKKEIDYELRKETDPERTSLW